MRFLTGCVIGHLVAVTVLPLAWWAPNLTLVGVVLITAAFPGRWWLWSSIGGSSVMLWTTAASQPIAAGIMVIGGILWLLSRHWDLSDVRVQSLVVGTLSVFMTLWELSHLERWSIDLVMLALAHIIVTVACVPLLRRCLSAKSVISWTA